MRNKVIKRRHEYRVKLFKVAVFDLYYVIGLKGSEKL